MWRDALGGGASVSRVRHRAHIGWTLVGRFQGIDPGRMDNEQRPSSSCTACADEENSGRPAPT